MSNPATLLGAKRAFVIAPAGCGKTHLIAEAVCQDTSNRSLILTHTHAGVDVIRTRLKMLGADSSSIEVETIAGWSLRIVTSFPATSGITTQRPEDSEWNAVYAGAAQLLSISAIQSVIQASFNAVYVDEYQDCSILQHEIVKLLADILPARILGDPLQGIFDSGDSEIVNWENHVEPHFQALPRLSKPHRWAKTNPSLGEWLLAVRDSLESGQSIDISQAPPGSVTFVQLPSDPRAHWEVQRKVCISSSAGDDETSLFIHEWEAQCHKLVRNLDGRFRSPETIECSDLFETAKTFDGAPDNAALAKAAFEFACLCLTVVKTELQSVAARIFDGRGLQRTRVYQRQEQLDALARIVDTGTSASIRAALVMLAATPSAKKARHELYFEMLNALREHETAGHSTFQDAAVRVRERTRRMGRKPGHYVVSRTLLVKGLEFDHVVLLNGNALDRKNLYVALTRGSRSLKVLGTSPILNPK